MTVRDDNMLAYDQVSSNTMMGLDINNSKKNTT